MSIGLSDLAALGLAQAIRRRIPAILNGFRQREPLLSRVLAVRAPGRRLEVSVNLGESLSEVATYNLSSLLTGFSQSVAFLESLENDAYFDRAADTLAASIGRGQNNCVAGALYGDEPANFLGLSRYAPADVSDEWLGGIPPTTPGWEPKRSALRVTDPTATAEALFDLATECTDDFTEPTLIAAGPALARDVCRAFQPQQRFWSISGGISYFHVGMAELFSSSRANTNAAFVFHPRDFEFHYAMPLVTHSGGHLLTRVEQQLVCRRRYLLGRLQRYDRLHA